MVALDRQVRGVLENTVVGARTDAERGIANVFARYAVTTDREAFPAGSPEWHLWKRIRDRAALIGRGRAEDGQALSRAEAIAAGLPHLREELAYEAWHRLLFARFLAERNLLVHPVYGEPVSLADCADLAPEEGAANAWDLAARYAALRLPGLFDADGLSADLTLAPEDAFRLEQRVTGLPVKVFLSDDGLGWVYQFWQKQQKDAVNKAEKKIGGADVSPVTQLFTEDYMVRLLLENTLGAWWVWRHPESPLLTEWPYLRFRPGTEAQPVPAAGTFDGWPATTREITVIDPCCGSGHFPVAAFGMLRKMRMEEEGLSAADAADAVLRDNLFGLELDTRCTQIATFAVALAAWDVGGHPETNVPQIACSGIPVRGQLADWKKLADGDDTVGHVLEDLYRAFQDAPTLGSLINPRAISRDPLFVRDHEALLRRVTAAIGKANGGTDSEVALFGDAATKVALAADLLSREYTLVATNVPYLKRGSQDDVLRAFSDRYYPDAKADLATVFIDRCLAFARRGGDASSGTVAVVSPQNWLFLGSYQQFRKNLLDAQSFEELARLGTGAFETISGEIVNVSLAIMTNTAPGSGQTFAGIDAAGGKDATAKDEILRTGEMTLFSQAAQHRNPDERISLDEIEDVPLLEEYADGLQGIATADYPRYGRTHWEMPLPHQDWEYQQSTVEESHLFAGKEHIVWWPRGATMPYGREARIQGHRAWSRRGVAVAQMRILPASLNIMTKFDNNTAVILPKDGHEDKLCAIWAFCSSPEFNQAVRRIDTALKVTNASLVKVPFDLERWQKVADDMYPDGLPEPHSDDPTQWLFEGTIPGSERPLQVAVARLLGYHWPEQVDDGLDRLADPDGIVSLPAIAGEQPAAERLRALLQAAFGNAWSPELLASLLANEDFAGKDLATWLADKKGFFAQHVKLFHNRPFIWLITDGVRGGFAALVNYHQLTSSTLDKLIYTYLGAWIARQRTDTERSVAGAEGRLEAAEALQTKLKLIARGEPPYDIYVRWKSLAEQPIGWEPDLDDGVRLNIRPFIMAGALGSSQTLKSLSWKADRGKDPVRPVPSLAEIPGERRESHQHHYDVVRHNDLHFTRAEKEAARESAASSTPPQAGEETDGHAYRSTRLGE